MSNFPSKEIKGASEEIGKVPHLVLRSKPYPMDDKGRINWDEINKDDKTYFEIVLSPFHEEMYDVKKGIKRNILIDKLILKIHDFRRIRGDSEAIKIADFGCGIGKILDYLSEFKNIEVYGFDGSEVGLEVAQKRALKLGVDFKPMKVEFEKENIEDLANKFKGQFDLVISVNSILPPSREQVSILFQNLKNILKKDGWFLGILPSFDTILFLRDLWKEYWEGIYRKDLADVCVETFDNLRRVNIDEMIYSDDGKILQCYHNPHSLKSDLENVGFGISGDWKPEKVTYPWELVEKYGYANFKDSTEDEIWDWYVEAKSK